MPAFSSPPNQQNYYAEVWMIVRQIPLGKVASYGQIAKMIPPPNGVNLEAYQAFAPRWVGGAMANCPADVPWQRVINSQGKISARAGAERQRQLLEQEGVEFDAKDRIDLKKYGWAGSAPTDSPIQKTLFN
ncbi:MAG: MGMT family protein [Anaerolineales bacterium]|nr:MGMT family protein [Anaerolineales bacterium]